MSARTIARTAALAALAIALLSGCVRLTSDTTVNPDDTFDQVAIVATTSAARSQLGSLGGVDLDNLAQAISDSDGFKQLNEDYPGKVKVEDYEDGDLTGAKITSTGLPLEAFQKSFAQMSTSLPLTGDATLVRTEDTYVVKIPAGGIASQLQQSGISASQLELLGSEVDVHLSFSFPGLVTSASAGTIDGNTVTIDVGDLAAGNEITIVAGAAPQVNWKPWLLWGGIGLAALVIIGGATALIVQDVRRHRSSALPVPDAAVADVTEGPGILATEPQPDPAPEEPPVAPEVTEEDTNG